MSTRGPRKSINSTSSSDILDLDLLKLDDRKPRNPFFSNDTSRRRPPTPPARPAPTLSTGPFVLAIDYGTTRTGISFAIDSDIQVLQDWGADMDNELKVRTAISYVNPRDGEEQWGFRIDDSRVAMVNTKLELEPQPTRFEELDLTLHALKGLEFLQTEHMIRQGPSPEYSSKAPGEIITDYLKHVFKHTYAEIEASWNLKALIATRTPVDLVITMPVGWSYHAQDTIFKAIRHAGFNNKSFPTLRDTILVSEPEAASYFTAQQVRDNDGDCFKENDCFVLCDAGGGTVDVVAFQVKKLKPDLVLEMVTEATGAKCGSALIDTEFKAWLRNVINEHNYAELDPLNGRQQRISPHAAESGPMRELIRRFNVEKHKFSNDGHSDIKIEMPEPLHNLTISGRVEQGLLTIHRNEMRKLMDHCVNDVLKLIKEQIEKVTTAKGQRVWNVLLVGGFGASPYLKNELRKSLGRKRPPIGIHVPNDEAQATAVVQGAVIYGLEKGRHKNAIYMSAITRSYGIVINGNFKWLMRKGDLACSTTERIITSETFLHCAEPGAGQQYEFSVYTYNARNEDDDYVPDTWSEGQNEVQEITRIRCDFSKHVQSKIFSRATRIGTNGGEDKTHVGPLQWRIKVLATNVAEAEILYKEEPVGNSKWKIEIDSQRGHKISAVSVSIDDD